MRLADLPSPSILVESSRLEANLQRMQEKADANKVALRPHTKTHKSVVLAHQQLERGARGLTVAKVGEAEVYAAHGFDNLRLAYIVVGEEKYARLLAMMNRARLSFCVDTEASAREASAFFASSGVSIEVLVEVDTGYGRCGVRWDREESVSFARWVSELPGLKLAGILTQAGNAYAGPQVAGETLDESLQRVSAEECDRMLDFAIALHEAGVKEATPNAATDSPNRFEISIGSTPSMKHFQNVERGGFTITEIRPGNYVFNDAIQQALGVVGWEACSMTVLTTVISKHRNANGSERLFLDAGRKVFTSDTGYNTQGYGCLLYNSRTMTPLPHARITGLSEEHGWVSVPGGSTLEIGNQVRAVPNHACVVMNGQDQFYLVDGDEVVESLEVDARGRVW
jgi:D-serine deaminase-like pyridoxal phosphate-dependent protein